MMHPTPAFLCRNPARQRGWSLVSLMVGLVVSLLVIIAMLSLYRVVAQNAFSGKTGMQPTADQDRQITTGLLAAQNLLQGAGFGMAGAAYNTNLVVVGGATWPVASGTTIAGAVVAAGASGNAIFWESANAPGGTPTCAGLIATVDAPTQTLFLYLLQSSAACSPISNNWNTKSLWTATQLIGTHNENANPISFSASLNSTNPCWPFGAEVPAANIIGNVTGAAGINSTQSGTPGLAVTLNWQTINQSAGSWMSCLPNFSS